MEATDTEDVVVTAEDAEDMIVEVMVNNKHGCGGQCQIIMRTTIMKEM